MLSNIGKTSRKKYTPVCIVLAGAIGIIKCRNGAGGLALDLSCGGAGGTGYGVCAVYEEVLSSARGVFEESERGGGEHIGAVGLIYFHNRCKLTTFVVMCII